MQTIMLALVALLLLATQSVDAHDCAPPDLNYEAAFAILFVGVAFAAVILVTIVGLAVAIVGILASQIVSGLSHRSRSVVE